MSLFTIDPASVYSPADSNGDARGANMGEAQTLAVEMGNLIEGLALTQLIFATKALLDADLAHAADTLAVVFNDNTKSNNGYYQKSGASGSGSWTRIADLPYSFILASNAGAGTANAIVATTPTGVPAADGGALVALPIVATNTSTPVTVAFDGGSALTIKTNAGNNPAVGGLVNGMIVAGYKSGSTFRLLSDQASAAIQTASEAAQTAAEAAQAAAEAARDEAQAAVPNTFTTSLANMALLDPATKTQCFLNLSGKEGQWMWDSSDLSTEVATDTVKGIFNPPNFAGYASDGTQGAWRRIVNAGLPALSSWFDHDLQVARDTLLLTDVKELLANKIGTISPSTGLSMAGVSLKGLGADLTTIDFSAIAAIDLIDNLYGIAFDGAGLTSVGTTWSAISGGDTSIAFGADPGVAEGQIICVYNSANGSFLPAVGGVGGRDYYRAGQRVRKVDQTGNTVNLDQAFYASYVASGGTVEIYKQASVTGSLEGLTLTMEGSAVAQNRVGRIFYGDRFRVRDIRSFGGAYEGLLIDQCYETDIDGGTFATDLQTAQANSYPLSVVNSQHTRARNFSAAGKWNGIGTGGYDKIGAIPNFDTEFSNFSAVGHDAPGCDVHGNSYRTRFVNGTCRNGVSFGGWDTVYEDCKASDDDYLYAITMSEVAGGRQAFVGPNARIEVRRANFTGRGSIDGYGGTSFRAAFAETFIEIDAYVTAPLADTLILFNNDSASYPVSHDINLRLGNVAALTVPLGCYSSAGAGAAKRGRLRVSGLPVGVKYATWGGTDPYDVSEPDYPVQRGAIDFTTTASPSVSSTSFNFDHAWPKAPKFLHAPTLAPNGEAALSMQWHEATTTSYRVTLYRADGTNFTTGKSTKVVWSARL